jgi:hypothetical protein
MNYTLSDLYNFVEESYAIENVYLSDEQMDPHVAAHDNFLKNFGRSDPNTLELEDVLDLQELIQPGAPLRLRPDQNVMIGGRVCEPGSPFMKAHLENILYRASHRDPPFSVHHAFEQIHPFMDGNGRIGRAIWAWQMVRQYYDFRHKFLQMWYYQSLADKQGVKL